METSNTNGKSTNHLPHASVPSPPKCPTASTKEADAATTTLEWKTMDAIHFWIMDRYRNRHVCWNALHGV